MDGWSTVCSKHPQDWSVQYTQLYSNLSEIETENLFYRNKPTDQNRPFSITTHHLQQIVRDQLDLCPRHLARRFFERRHVHLNIIITADMTC